MKLSKQLSDAIETFKAQNLQWSTQSGALNQCHSASVRFIAHLGLEGIRAELLSINQGEHVVVIVDGVMVDWTARQFDPDDDFPKITEASHGRAVGKAAH